MRGPGDTDFLQGSVACTATGLNKFLVLEAATAVVSCAHGLREELPEDGFSFNMVWVQIAEGSREEQHRLALIMDLVVSLRNANDASSTTIRWPDPKSYSSHRKRRMNSAKQAHQIPGVGDGPG